VFNLEVQVKHAYHVAAGGVLVHNGGPCSTWGFEIIDGTRRAKAAQLHGHTHIMAEIVDSNGKVISLEMIPIDRLRSVHKSHIDISSPGGSIRWHRVVDGAGDFPAGAANSPQNQLPFPAIQVRTGSGGIPLPSVDVY
jgi:hypothetical protein